MNIVKTIEIKMTKILCFILFIVVMLAFITIASNNLTVHYIDVGQADSILLQLRNNETMLIDAGNNEDGDFVANYIHNQGIFKIDYLIGTHPH